ncbi:MAG: tRNA uridine-5-carboxymethylaminomethyl(34) synthesis enzyme MnmG [Candidatus Omnitrophota bacterium]
MRRYDIIVVGAGHAGCEAALAAARMKLKTLLITMDKESIAQMSCNPAIGGLGKSQLVREIDALGGEMAKATDAAGIHFRMLNRSKGPAVWSLRVQADRHKYSKYMQDVILSEKNLQVAEDEVTDILVRGKRIRGVRVKDGKDITAKAVILTPGTFLNGLIHIGLEHKPGGRYGEAASIGLSESLKKMGFNLSTLKTGTTPRIKKSSIDFTRLMAQPGDKEPFSFSFSTKKRLQNKVLCHLTYTNPKTHHIIRSGLDRSPLYTGIITSVGARYCPSVEDKVVKFSERERHQVFLEPEGLDTDWYYPNGLATSLPLDIQHDMIHSIEGLEEAEILRPGYGIEYEFIQPTQLFPTLESKLTGGLYFAGQINGTTGYEEAAAQGLIAGINASLKLKKMKDLVLGRSESYIGVLIDDLVTKGTNEPYRMFTSRVEYRLMLREDNADIRLRKYGYNAGLITKEELKNTEAKAERIDAAVKKLNIIKIKPGPKINKMLEGLHTSSIERTVSATELLKRPQVMLEDLKRLNIVSGSLSLDEERTVDIMIKYEGFIKRQMADIRKMEDVDKIRIPKDMDFSKISGLSREIVEKLNGVRPFTLGQASRISGVTPAAIMLLMVYLKKPNTTMKL